MLPQIKQMLGKVLLAVNPFSPLNWIVIVILGISYKVSIKKRFDKLFANALQEKRCLSGDKYCLTKSRLYFLGMVALYMAITLPIYTVGCMIFPHLPPPVGPIMSFIC